MREILFRGKRIDGHKDNTENGTMLYGSLFVGKQGQPKIKWYCEKYNVAMTSNIDPKTVGQYTGLHDGTKWDELTAKEQTEWLKKHTADEWKGKPIFEGDIVDASRSWWNAAGPAGHDSPIIEVEWDDYVCGFAPFAQYDCDCGVYINGYECRVIGNVYDNPELLEK